MKWWRGDKSKADPARPLTLPEDRGPNMEVINAERAAREAVDGQQAPQHPVQQQTQSRQQPQRQPHRPQQPQSSRQHPSGVQQPQQGQQAAEGKAGSGPVHPAPSKGWFSSLWGSSRTEQEPLLQKGGAQQVSLSPLSQASSSVESLLKDKAVCAGSRVDRGPMHV